MLVDVLSRNVAIVDSIVALNQHDASIDADQASFFPNEDVLLDSIVEDVDVSKFNRTGELNERTLKFHIDDLNLHMLVILKLVGLEESCQLWLAFSRHGGVVSDVNDWRLLWFKVIPVHELVDTWCIVFDFIGKLISMIFEYVAFENVFTTDNIDARSLLLFLLILHWRHHLVVFESI